MDIKSIELRHIQLPLRFSFKTAKGELNKRDTLVIKAIGKDGLCGFGEVVAFMEPFYTAETLPCAAEILRVKYIPEILGNDIAEPFALHRLFAPSLPMALAGLENALLDLAAKRKGQNIIEMLFNEKLPPQIEGGVVLGDMRLEELARSVEYSIAQGYQRIKFKIYPSRKKSPLENLVKIRQNYPDLKMMADANCSFPLTAQGREEAQLYNELGLVCIEELFDMKGKLLHEYSDQECQVYKESLRSLKFKVCHDESIQSLEDLETAFAQKILQMVNIKIGRLGGLFYAQKIIEFCCQKNIPYFIGSMVESGISKVLHVQLASLAGACLPGDLSDSTRYFLSDLIRPSITAKNGLIQVPNGPGLGVEIDEVALAKYTKNCWIFS